MGGKREFGLEEHGALKFNFSGLASPRSRGRFLHGNSRVREVFCTPGREFIAMTLHTPEMRDEDGVKLSAGAVCLTLVHLFLFIYFLTSKNVIQRFGTLVPPSARRVRRT